MRKLFLIILLGLFVFAGADAQDLNAQVPEVQQSDSTGGNAINIDSSVEQLRDLISLNKVVMSLFVIFLTYFFNKALVFVLGRVAEIKTSYRLIVKRVIPFLNIILWSLAIYIVIEGVLNPPLQTLLAVGASVGIAVGFAAQDIVKNIFGGFIIILDRPFQIGDKIEVNGHYGEVTEIGLRSIRLQTPDDSMVTVPNAEIVNHEVSNSNTGALYCQVVTSIFLPATVSIDEIKALAYKAAVVSRYVYLNKPVVVLAEHKMRERRFAIELKVKAYVLDIRYEFLLKSEITELILKELQHRNIMDEPNGDSDD